MKGVSILKRVRMGENCFNSKSNSPVLRLLHPSSSYCSSQVYTDDLLWFSVYIRAKWNQLLCTYTELYSTVQPVHTVQTSAPNNARHWTYRVEIRVPIDLTDTLRLYRTCVTTDLLPTLVTNHIFYVCVNIYWSK